MGSRSKQEVFSIRNGDILLFTTNRTVLLYLFQYEWPDISDHPTMRETKIEYKFDYLPAGLFNRGQVNDQAIYITVRRMNSSRMRTARSLPSSVPGGSLSSGVSVHGGSLSRGVSVQRGSLSRGGLCQEDPPHVDRQTPVKT